MAIVTTVSNHFKFQLASGNIDFDADTFKVILMNTTFAFDKDADATLSDVTSDQIATGNGYTQNDKTLSSVSVTEDDTNDKCTITWTNPSWTASGGAIATFGAMIIYDDTSSDDTVVCCVDFGTDYSIGDTASFEPQSITIDIS